MATREFHLGDILSVTTGRLVSPRHLTGVFDLMEWMTLGGVPYAECGRELLRQHPDLGDVNVPEQFAGEADAKRWLAAQVGVYGTTRTVRCGGAS